MSQRPFIAALFAVSALSGCAATPPSYTSKVVLPDQFLGESVRQSNLDSTPRRLQAWWTLFGDSQLDGYVATALQQNLDLAQAMARTQQARAGLSAATAALLPSANLSGQAAKATQSLETPLGQVLSASPGFDRHGESYELNLLANWEIDLSGGLQRSREAAKADYEASEAGIAATRLTIASAVVDTYIVIRGLQARLDVAERQVQTRRALLEKVEKLYAEGLTPEVQVRQASASVSEAEARIPALNVALDGAMNALDILLGTPAGTHRTELTPHRSLPAVVRIAPAGTPSELLRRRPDLIVAERHLTAAIARKDAATTEYYPKFSLGALLGGATSVSSGNLFSDRASQSAVTLGLRWRVFDFARIDAQIKQAKGDEAQALSAYRLAALRATEDVENAYSAAANQSTQDAVLAQGVADLERARSATEAAYQAGAVSQIEVLGAEDAALRARDARIQSMTGVSRASVAVFKSLGGDI
ncbi:efflux transporter outer membrane subunit [Asticcacaulis excentricus]|uniref:Outer membrane protein n=1 Tax=Asticcacaulis excentricus TaxID=78587 RepID=A0A3G9GDE4_9CAUL|nr:TolC family protein [Asticcacaulis excentricus]BBF82698.1 outer membrane protein [Asticcacaulis excentricus]